VRSHRDRSVSLRALALICSLIAAATSTRAQDSPAKPLSGQYAELNKQLQVQNNQASLDTTPITFSIAEAKYKVPRNYIVWMDNWNGGPQTLVRFKVTYPKFEPLDQRNAPCMALAPLYRPPGCLPVEFIVANGGRSVGGGGWAASDEEAFNNIRDVFHSQTPLRGRYGFEVYETGPENARIETYRKRTPEHVLILNCFFQNPDSRATAQCNNQSRLADHNELEFGLYFDQLQNAEEIDGRFRSLVKSFTVPTK
jgi:hypothetical protein